MAVPTILALAALGFLAWAIALGVEIAEGPFRCFFMEYVDPSEQLVCSYNPDYVMVPMILLLFLGVVLATGLGFTVGWRRRGRL